MEFFGIFQHKDFNRMVHIISVGVVSSFQFYLTNTFEIVQYTITKIVLNYGLTALQRTHANSEIKLASVSSFIC